jgi:hypothetical protein
MQSNVTMKVANKIILLLITMSCKNWKLVVLLAVNLKVNGQSNA